MYIHSCVHVRNAVPWQYCASGRFRCCHADRRPETAFIAMRVRSLPPQDIARAVSYEFGSPDDGDIGRADRRDTMVCRLTTIDQASSSPLSLQFSSYALSPIPLRAISKISSSDMMVPGLSSKCRTGIPASCGDCYLVEGNRLIRQSSRHGEGAAAPLLPPAEDKADRVSVAAVLPLLSTLAAPSIMFLCPSCPLHSCTRLLSLYFHSSFQSFSLFSHPHPFLLFLSISHFFLLLSASRICYYPASSYNASATSCLLSLTLASASPATKDAVRCALRNSHSGMGVGDSLTPSRHLCGWSSCRSKRSNAIVLSPYAAFWDVPRLGGERPTSWA